MRKLFLLVFVLISQVTFAQKTVKPAPSVPMVNNEIVYEEDYTVSGHSQAQFFHNAEAWFVKRYNSSEEIESKDAATGKVLGNGIETLIFKGPMGMDVPCKIKMKIEIVSKDSGYKVKIYNIVYGYQAEPTDERTFFSAEDLSKYVTTGKNPKNEQGINIVPLTKKRSIKALEGLTPFVNNILASINQTMKE
ncbi:DUF4468 domain-containing protein [Mucilaginibacter sp. dw_454]|uniref:DUF4468 domain-containing protein n=1 Tax=Mucilaginibacter sp. dw_454 TaxID=2720079 RepID=UPI001BD4D237|nr:DUF4468 domain-containing protein [Mucilaginibacter sp. dw_454]